MKIELISAGKFIVTGGYTFETETAAQAHCDAYEAYWKMQKPFETFSTLDRPTYERLCTELHIEMMSDADVDSYGVRYGEFRLEVPGVQQGSPLSHLLKMDLARLRMHGIDQERAVQPKPARTPDYPTGRKLGCGCTVYYQSEVMNASMGTSCSNCYDRMSD